MPRPPHISGDIYRWGPHYANLTAVVAAAPCSSSLTVTVSNVLWLLGLVWSVWAAARSPRFGQWTMFYAVEPT